MGSRAECVMLNKGPYIDRAVQFLRNVLGRMQAHHEKRAATLRQLSIADLPHTEVPFAPVAGAADGMILKPFVGSEANMFTDYPRRPLPKPLEPLPELVFKRTGRIRP